MNTEPEPVILKFSHHDPPGWIEKRTAKMKREGYRRTAVVPRRSKGIWVYFVKEGANEEIHR